MKIAFLGTGSAFSLERYPGAALVNDHILFDAGPPLLPHLHRMDIDPAGINLVFITHFHGDHFLGLPTFLHFRGSSSPGHHLTIIGPRGVAHVIDTLCQLSWGSDWAASRTAIPLSYVEARDSGTVSGVTYQTRLLSHSNVECRGYRINVNDQVLVYAGDTTVTPELHELIRGADVVITEATAPTAPGHTSWSEAHELAKTYPNTRFVFNHLSAGTTPQAAGDFEVLDL
jgi:ribonuclease BN (tRNA processing enzyme)